MKKYPKYKDSGVEWLGEVPEEWEVWKISHAFRIIGSGTTPKSGSSEFYDNGTINWVNTGDLNDGFLDSCEKKITRLAHEQHSTLKIYPKGTLLIAMYGATIGKTAILNFEACTNQACCALSNSNCIENRFAYYWFWSHRNHIISLSYGGGQPNISQDIIRSLKMPVPSKSEQQKILSFLDHATARLDRFIALRQQQCALLKEQRAALIQQAVTKGIRPGVKMKDSGVEWIGEVPEGWEVVKMKFLLSEKMKYGANEAA